MHFETYQDLEKYVQEEGICAWNFPDHAVVDYCKYEIGGYFFRRESDIIEYVVEDLDMKVFCSDDEVFEYARENDSSYVNYQQPDRTGISSFRFQDVFDKLQKLTDEYGYEPIYDYLNNFKK